MKDRGYPPPKYIIMQSDAANELQTVTAGRLLQFE